MKTIVTLIFVNIASILTAQTTIYGKVVFADEPFPAFLASVECKNEKGVIVDSTLVNGLGVYAIHVSVAGIYSVEARYESYMPALVTSIPVSGNKDSLEVNINLFPALKNENCKLSFDEVKCPHCNSNDQVCEALPGMIVSYNFGDSKRKLKKYLRHRNRVGYETSVVNGKLVVWNVLIEEEREKFYSYEYCWFCRRDKKVF